jgi:nucleoside-diphosphate-sugar epimerase
MARVVVTGAAGFVGRALVTRLLARGDSVVRLVHVVDPRASQLEPDTYVLDLGRETLPRICFDGAETVFHLAGRTPLSARERDEASAWQRVNVEGTRAVAEAARAAGARLVHVSSVAVYGPPAGAALEEGAPLEENAPLEGRSLYARSKIDGESTVRALGTSGLASVVVRPAPVYGPGHHGRLARMLGAVRRGLFPRPPAGGVRSHLHVENLVDALLLLSRHPAAVGGTFNAADAAPQSAREIFDAAVPFCRVRPLVPPVPEWLLRAAAATGDAAGRLLGRPLPFNSEALDRLRSPFVVSTRRLESLGWKPRRSLREALPVLLGREGERP